MISTPPFVYIVVLNWNSSKHTIACVRSIEKLDYLNYKILIVDNGSSDDSESLLRKEFPGHLFLQTNNNLGYAGGNNAGIRLALKANADYIFLLNNDVIVDPLVLSALTQAADKNPAAAVLGPKIYYLDSPDKIWCAGNRWIENLASYEYFGKDQPDNGKGWEKTINTSFVPGCALFVSTAAVKSTGFMDESFFLCWEEIDWCSRFQKKGYECLMIPKAKVWHRIAGSFAGGSRSLLRYYFNMRNRLLWMERHIPLFVRIRLYRVLIKEFFGILFLEDSPKKRKRLRVLTQATFDYLFRSFGKGPRWVWEADA